MAETSSEALNFAENVDHVSTASPGADGIVDSTIITESSGRQEDRPHSLASDEPHNDTEISAKRVGGNGTVDRGEDKLRNDDQHQAVNEASSDGGSTASDGGSEDDDDPSVSEPAHPMATALPTPIPANSKFTLLPQGWLKPLWGKKSTSSVPEHSTSPAAVNEHGAVADDTVNTVQSKSQAEKPAKRGSGWSESINKSLSDMSSAMNQFAEAVESTFIPEPHNPSARKSGESADLFNNSITEVIADLGKDIATGFMTLTTQRDKTNTKNRPAGPGTEPLPSKNVQDILEFHNQVAESYEDEFNTKEEPVCEKVGVNTAVVNATDSFEENSLLEEELFGDLKAEHQQQRLNNDISKKPNQIVDEEDCYV
jgi:hypothetical protein